MAEVLKTIADFITGLDPVAIYLCMVIVAYLENVIPPVPGDIFIVYGGYLAAEGLIGFVPLLFWTSVSATAGFMTYFYFGWRWGDEASIASRHKYLSRFMDVGHIDRAMRYMQQYGEWVILANRFLAGTRSIISLSAGMSRMNWWHTAINASISAIVWNAILIAAGWQLETNWSVFGGYLKTYGQIVAGILVLGLLARWIYNRRNRNIEKEKSSS